MVHDASDREHEPLLGRPGDATQHGQPIARNLWLGTAVLAQAGIWILTAVIWSAIFEGKVELFSAHPLLNSAGILLTTQAILVLQPTATASEKQQGVSLHFALQSVSAIVLVGGLIVIEYNKIANGGAHFKAVHNYLGVTFYVLLTLQAVAGTTQYFYPPLYGGVDNAKKLYKFHRLGGYVTLLLGIATVVSVYWTDWNVNVGGIRLWTLVVTSVLILAGIVPRIKLVKLGWRRDDA